MRKWKTLLSAIAMMLAVGMFTQTAYAAEEATVHEVDDITDVSSLTPDVYEVGAGNYENSVKFHLDKAGYVYVAAGSDVCYEGWGNLGSIEYFAVYTDASCKNLVNGDQSEAVWAEEFKIKKLCLEAGDYWVYFAKGNEPDDDYDVESTGEFALTVAVQYLDVAGNKNTTKEKAAKLDTNEDEAGFLSATTRTAWFSFDVASDNTVVNIGASIENAFEGEQKYNMEECTGVTIYNSKNSFVSAFNIDNTYNTMKKSELLTLKKGTYYIKVTGNNAYDDWGDLYTFERDNMGKINLHVVAVEPVAVAKWKNTKGLKAKLTYKKQDNVESYEIQYSTDVNFEKDVKKKEAGSETTKVTFKNLAKNNIYYVRVRAWEYDALEEETFAGAWGAVKKVKITK